MPVSVAGGTITDLFPPEEVFLSLSLFSCAPFFGAVIGKSLFLGAYGNSTNMLMR